MNREFLDFYRRELELLYEQAADFAEEYPGIAERLGGLARERMDPMVAGLLEGAAFLAARVQLKIKSEFPEFTQNLIEQLLPNFLAPTPSVLLARVKPIYGDPALRDGSKIPRGSSLDATYVERQRRVACRFTLTSDITVWPFEIVKAEYLIGPGPHHALGVPVGEAVLAGLRLTLTHRATARADEEKSDAAALTDPVALFAGCKIDELPIHLVGPEADAVALCEQVVANRVGLHIRYLDEFGDPVVFRADGCTIEQLGFDEADALMPSDERIFEGFKLLREYFMFPRKFMGFRIGGLKSVLPRLRAKTIDLFITFNELNQRLASTVEQSHFALYAAPAINLFEKIMDRTPVKSGLHEYHVIADRNHALDFEPHQLMSVFAHRSGGREKVTVHPLYSGRGELAASGAGLFYTLRRLPRRRSTEERRFGLSTDYVGTESFIAITAADGLIEEREISELSFRALCTNRHLPAHLPIAEGGADFRLLEKSDLEVVCISGPTKPRESVVSQLRGRAEMAGAGVVAWRLINLMGLNQLGLVERGGGRDGRALREALAMFADLSDAATERRIRGVRGIDSRPVVRRLRDRLGVGAARGLEVTVTVDEKAFEGSGVFVLGSLLDRFFCEYAALNHFTQTVLRSTERGEIMRWPPRLGSRRPL